MRAIVGSTLARHLLVAHLDVSDQLEWTASLSGELEFPTAHVCRGIYLAERSPFVDVVSTEKRKRASFFHAATSAEPQAIHLSRFKVPRRRPDPNNSKATSKRQRPTRDVEHSTKSSADGDRENEDVLKLILTQMAAIQTQLNARFDAVDDKLQQLDSRLEQLERNGGTKRNMLQ
ncbi:hypothetical protein PHYBOEH_001196 [Phytophthora boehmeriae]|uniref:Uncharacterized protein n=1 Tax=Phytophthora boehmeriae TaxID=109152 RepID=A0A8T1WTL4_9STRA|nr:hypothetical protein PHYBOEH_001196 [Phytophthora boehmeriae]